MKRSAPFGNPSSVSGAAPTSHARLILDIEDGLDRIMGDRVLYLKLLRRFRHDHQATQQQIRHAVVGDQYASAQLRAHTLKGAAGMIGALALQDAAAALENTLRARAHVSALDQPLGQLDLALSQVLSTIVSILPDNATESWPLTEEVPDPANPGTLAVVGHLIGLLREGDGAAIDVLEHSATALAATLGVTLYQKVAAAAHQFDFEGALDALMGRD